MHLRHLTYLTEKYQQGPCTYFRNIQKEKDSVEVPGKYSA